MITHWPYACATGSRLWVTHNGPPRRFPRWICDCEDRVLASCGVAEDLCSASRVTFASDRCPYFRAAAKLRGCGRAQAPMTVPGVRACALEGQAPEPAACFDR